MMDTSMPPPARDISPEEIRKLSASVEEITHMIRSLANDMAILGAALGDLGLRSSKEQLPDRDLTISEIARLSGHSYHKVYKDLVIDANNHGAIYVKNKRHRVLKEFAQQYIKQNKKIA